MSKDEDDLEDKFINEQYKNWKVNSRYLYDVVLSHALDSPSSTIQFLPEKYDAPGKGLQEKRVLIGTDTSDSEQNYLLLAKVILPDDDDDGDAEQMAVDDEGTNRARVEIIQRINHDGEVKRARYMPQKPTIIATKAPSAEVFVFDYTKQPAKPDTDGVCSPDLKLVGHDKEGYGISWSTLDAGMLLSGSEDSTICLWNVEATHANHQAVEPVSVFKGHTGSVEDVAWHILKPKMFGSVGGDNQLMIWDTSMADKKPAQKVNAHSADINCLSFNPFNEYLLATGSADKTVALWDLRNTAAKLHAFECHTDEIIQVQWSFVYETILGSCSQDRKVAVMDISKIGDEQSKEDAEDGPPELLFVHGGHTAKVMDFCWNPHDPWLVGSVDDNNVLQIWQMASHIYKDDDDDGSDIPAKDLE
uniref:Histone-binding protein RBBP4-like N-terminal domain-containing protein n=1 Tax=Hanusia phi TaxID=3032 RepID=A0A7S0E291_9CRYP